MSDRCAFLLDLESFFLAREGVKKEQRPGELFTFNDEAKDLARLVRELQADGRLVMSRAYADFHTRRPTDDAEKKWDFFLGQTPRTLINEGFEPVQVFRYPGGANQGTGWIRLALDAVNLFHTGSIQHFILGVGDVDVVPLAQELRSLGAKVTVLGVADATAKGIRFACDAFITFEDLLESEGLMGSDQALTEVRGALRQLLSGRGPLHFASVRPLLATKLGAPIELTRFGCETLGDFLRRFAPQLGIRVERQEQDWMVELLSAGTEAEGDSPAPARPFRRMSGEDVHTVYRYRDLLRARNPRIYIVPMSDWCTITDLVYAEASSADPEEEVLVVYQSLMDDLIARLEEDMNSADKKVQATMFQLFKSGCFVCADESDAEGRPDFHWSKDARLTDGLESGEDMRVRVKDFIAQTLRRRLDSDFGVGEVKAEVFGELLFGQSASDDEQAAVRDLLAPDGNGGTGS